MKGTHTDRQVERRRYLQWVGLGGLTALAGCVGEDGGSGTEGGDTTSGSGTNGDSEETQTQSSGGRSGGHLRVGFPNAPRSLHPMKGPSLAGYVVRETMYSRLTNYNRDVELIPELATEWETNDAVDQYTFVLREGARFATIDQEVLAEDVKATVEVMQSEDRVASAARDVGPIESVEIEDDHRITFNLSQSDIVYPKRLAETGSTFNILPKNVIEDRWDEVDSTDFGSGPFTLTEYEDGSKYVFEANDNYYKTDGDGTQLPYLDKMTWLVNPDPVSRVNTLVDQRTDAVQELSNTNTARVDSTSGLSSQSRGSPGFQLVVLNQDLELDNGERPFADQRVLKAFKHAIDREAYQDATNGATVIGHHDPVAPVHPNYAPFDPGLEFGTTAQPDEARRLLEEAGYGDGLELPQLIYSANNPITPPIVQLFQEQMANVGVEFDISQVTEDTWLSDYWNSDTDWYWSEWSSRFEETTVHRLAVQSEGPWNTGRYANKDFDAAYGEYSTATDQETFTDAFQRAQKIFHQTGPWIILGHVKKFTANHDYVKNVDFPPSNSRSYHWNDWLTGDAPEGP
jgi:peptide/nickel transport system substrate-binding protein